MSKENEKDNKENKGKEQELPQQPTTEQPTEEVNEVNEEVTEQPQPTTEEVEGVKDEPVIGEPDKEESLEEVTEQGSEKVEEQAADNVESLDEAPIEGEAINLDFNTLVKDFRVEVDALHKLYSNSFGLQHTPLLRAKHWLGKVLGARNPHTVAYKVADTVKDIPATKDVVCEKELAISLNKFSLKSDLEKINYLRASIKEAISSWNRVTDSVDLMNRLDAIARTQVYVNLCEANMDLGERLAELKKNA